MKYFFIFIVRQNRYDNYETNKIKPHVFNSKSPDYLRSLFKNLFFYILHSIYNTLSKNSKASNENDFKYKINYFSTKDRGEKVSKESDSQQSNSLNENPTKNNSTIKTNIYQTNNINIQIPASGIKFKKLKIVISVK